MVSLGGRFSLRVQPQNLEKSFFKKKKDELTSEISLIFTTAQSHAAHLYHKKTSAQSVGPSDSTHLRGANLWNECVMKFMNFQV